LEDESKKDVSNEDVEYHPSSSSQTLLKKSYFSSFFLPLSPNYSTSLCCWVANAIFSAFPLTLKNVPFFSEIPLFFSHINKSSYSKSSQFYTYFMIVKICFRLALFPPQLDLIFPHQIVVYYIYYSFSFFYKSIFIYSIENYVKDVTQALLLIPYVDKFPSNIGFDINTPQLSPTPSSIFSLFKNISNPSHFLSTASTRLENAADVSTPSSIHVSTDLHSQNSVIIPSLSPSILNPSPTPSLQSFASSQQTFLSLCASIIIFFYYLFIIIIVVLVTSSSCFGVDFLFTFLWLLVNEIKVFFF
jgi:hypothetical protein